MTLTQRLLKRYGKDAVRSDSRLDMNALRERLRQATEEQRKKDKCAAAQSWLKARDRWIG